MTAAGNEQSETDRDDSGGLSADDSSLATVLETWLTELRRGELPDPEIAISEHPHLAEELRGLWSTALVAEQFAGDPIKRGGENVGSRATNQDPSDRSATEVWPGRGPSTPSSERSAYAATEIELPEQFGDYVLEAELGRGGMGTVYRARDQRLGRVVALKMIADAASSSPEERARFRAEAEAAAQLDHPEIVPVYEVGEIEGRLYFTMRLVEGCTLAAVMANGPLDAGQAAATLAPICRAIDYAHRRGVLHRDLKPSNILIDEDGHPFVTDFGLAKRIKTDASITQTGAILGTPNYMAPEQATGNRGQLGPKTDVYSLGTILYQMLTGRVPFEAASPLDTVLMLLEQEPTPPRRVRAGVNRDLEMVALKCLQKPQDLRYATAGELAADLEAFVHGDAVSARSGTFRDVLTRAFRDTHHAPVLENWGLLWMWHAVVLLAICVVTNLLQFFGVEGPLPYLALWTVGVGTWAGIFWTLRRRAGPVTFVERQIAHVWAASIVTNALLFVIEIVLSLPVLTLSPVIGAVGGMVFTVKAGILSGEFYVQAVALYLTAIAMAAWPEIGPALFGLVSAVCFFVPGWKYHRQRLERDPD